MTDGGRDLFLSTKHGGTELWLIRHGDSLPGPYEVVLDGLYNSQALSELGRRQALALDERMRADRPNVIYSSPIRRVQRRAHRASDRDRGRPDLSTCTRTSSALDAGTIEQPAARGHGLGRVQPCYPSSAYAPPRIGGTSAAAGRTAR